MEKKCRIKIMRLAWIAAFLFIGMPGVFAQEVDAEMIDSNEFIMRYAGAEEVRPVFFALRSEPGAHEIHLLDTLSSEERSRIEESFQPPAVGVIRDLNQSVSFYLSQADIPGEGELSVAGGRLTRINKDTLVFTSFFQSLKADEIRVFFEEGHFPGGVQVNIFSENDYAFTETQLRGRIDEYGFYTTTTFADHLTIQVVIPLEQLEEELYFVISRIIHVDNRYLPEDERACTLDANCSTANSFSGINGLRRSSGRLYFPVGTLYYFCSGNQINDARAKDWQPFLLTANHCFSTQASAAGLEARFYYWSTSCNSGVVNPSHIIRNGANLIATNSQTDFTLVLMKQFSADYFLGWSTSAVANNTVLHSTHHPGGTLLKYQRMQNKTSPDFTCTGFSTANYHYTQTTHGRSAGGSSGAAVIDAEMRIRGQLYGWCFLSGADECSYSTYYNMWGRFNVTYANNNLQYWLNNGGASVAMSTIPLSGLNYGNVNVGSSFNLNVTVTNTGTRPNFMNLEAGNATITGTNANQFSIIGSNFLYLAPGESGTFTVRFTPSSGGTKTATLNIPHNADNITSPRTITLTGTGVANPCSDIISLGSGGSANAKTYSKSGTGAWNTTVCGWATPGQEQVYSFVAPYTGNYSIQVTETNNTYVNYFWKSGSCSQTGWNCISDLNSPGVYGNFTLTAGQTYHILLDSETTALATHTFFVFYNPCQNITNIAGAGAANTQTYTGGGSGAWFTTTASPCGFACPGVENIYSFTPTVTGVYQVEVTAASGWVNYMWKSGACNADNWECISDLSSPGVYGSMDMTAGMTYLILLDDENSTPGTHQFFIRDPLLFTLTFTVNDSNGDGISDAVVNLDGTVYPAGTYIFNDLEPGIYNYSIARSCYETTTGQVNIVAADVTEDVVLTNLPGDANDDGVVNVSDVVVIVNYFMGESPSPFCFNNADVNNDGEINVQDVVGTVNIFMSGKMDPWIALNSSVAYLHLKADGIFIESDGTLAGIQFELTGDNLDEMELISRLPGHAMTHKVVDGILRVLIFSIDNSPIAAGNISLADIKNPAENLQWHDAAAANLNADAVEVILLTEPLGWRNADAPEGLRVYPNPVKDLLWVEFHNHSGKPAEVSLTNTHAQQITAQKVIEQGDIMVSFKMNELAPGVYFIRVDIDGRYFYEKIIVN
ncbi:MAG: choice-of-anchor D domain-containing protein [Bacteroidetes bacterium]|nr:MAG: choice-of-anchor D domain-containing protein [Bacteroidota bacterium]